MAPKGKANKNYMLELSDEDIGGDNQSAAFFGDDDVPMDEDFAPAAPGYDQDDISFAHDDELPPSDPINFDDAALRGYDDHARDSSIAPLRGYARDPDYAPNAAGDEDNEVEAPSAKRKKTTLAVRSKDAQPGHFRQTTLAAERSAMRVTADESRNYQIEDGPGLSYSAPSRTLGTFGKRDREKGSTLPAYHRKVTHELDADDELMMAMRESGYSDKQIAAKLAKVGGTKYDPKSVSTRIQRIKTVQSQHADFELENGMLEWTMEDDRLLLRAYDLASIEIAYEMERLRAWRFKKTAEWMRRMNKDSLFSGKACHARYASLLDGTATIPCDVDDNPAARHAEMEAFRRSKEAERDAARDAEEARAAEAERIKTEAAARQAQINLEKAEKRAAARQAQGARATKRATKKTLEQRQAEDHLKKTKAVAAEKAAKKAATEADIKFKQDFALKHFRHVTEATPDPRRVLDLRDLRMLCSARSLNHHVAKKDGAAKKVLLKRLRDADEALKVPELRDIVKAQGIPGGGNKVQMIYQLALCAARSCDSYVEDGEDEDEEADGGDEAEGMEVDGVE